MIQVQATDADNGQNAEIEYSIQKGGYEDFVIDNSSGIVSVQRKLDYDRRNIYNIEIIATDFGTPRLTGTTTLMVNVINVNDKVPVFVPTTQTAEVRIILPLHVTEILNLSLIKYLTSLNSIIINQCSV